ncbi:MAG: flagellar biosynthesis anti-sigma factor FlgM [Planctomycetota bacterium]
MEINRVDPSFPIRPARARDLYPVAPSELPADHLSISPQARLRDQLRAAPDIRGDRVADLRRRIQNGAYDEGAVMSEAVKRFLAELG